MVGGRLDRREWIQVVGGAALTGRRTIERADESNGEDETADDYPLMDVHVHVIPTEAYGREPVSVDEMVAWMDEHGIDESVVLSLDSPESFPVTVPSWWVLEQAEQYTDRLIPFCTVDPRADVFGEDTVVERIRTYVERGARGFGELKAGLPIDDERLDTVYEVCADENLPILFHTDEKAMTDEVGLPGLEDVLESYPDVDFIAHASGWWSHISADVTESDLGDYPDGEIETGGRVDDLLVEYDNIYGDLSGPSGWNALTRDEAYAEEFLERHDEQLVFGTDHFYEDQSIPQFALFDRFDLPSASWERIRFRNLDRLV